MSMLALRPAVAIEKGCTRYVWQVLDWNTPSLEFYKAMGATVLEEWLTCRVEGEALARLAARAARPRRSA